MSGLKRTYHVYDPSTSSRKSVRRAYRVRRGKPISQETRLRRMVKKEIAKSQETKWNVANGTEVSLPVATSYTMVDFPLALSQGTTASNRVGNKVTLTALDCNEVFWNPSADTAEGVSIRRIILKVDGGVYQTNSEVADDLFEGTTTDGAPNGTTLDLVRKVNRQSMYVLKDDVIMLNAAASGHSQAHTKNYFPMNQVLEFQQSSTAQPVNWRYVVIYIARQTANDGALFNCELTYQLGAYFKDN